MLGSGIYHLRLAGISDERQRMHIDIRNALPVVRRASEKHNARGNRCDQQHARG